MALWNKLNACGGAIQIVREAEILYGADSPFTAVLQMYHLTLAGGKPTGSKLRWVFESVLDMKRAGCLKNEEISKNKLQDGSSLTPADLYAVKFDLLSELLGPTFLNSIAMAPGVSAVFQKVFSSHRAFRAAFGYRNNEKAMFNGDPTHDSWRSALSPSEVPCSLAVELFFFSAPLLLDRPGR